MDPEKAETGKKKNHKYYDCSSQDEIPIKGIKRGIIQTVDNRYVSFVEVLPIAFDKLSEIKQENVLLNFQQIFNNGPAKMQFVTLSDTVNPNDQIRHINKLSKKTDGNGILHARQDYINHIRQLSQKKTNTKRYLVVWEYSGERDGSAKKEFDDIAYSMANTRLQIISTLSACGNKAVTFSSDEEWNVFVYETLYYFFNRSSYRNESLGHRRDRIKKDLAIFNEHAEKRLASSCTDFIAPKGLYFTNKEAIWMDGFYYTYVALTSSFYPINMGTTLLANELSSYGSSVDVSFTVRRLPRNETELFVKTAIKEGRSRIWDLQRRNKQDRAAEVNNKLESNSYILNCLKNGEDIYDVCCILSIRAKTMKQLRANRDLIVNSLRKEGEVEVSYLRTEEYFRMSMPLIYVSPVFGRNKRNFLTSSMGLLYNYTAYNMNDINGIVIGTSMTEDQTETTFSFDNFNRNYYANPNMFVSGTSGAGKTYTLQWLGRTMRLTGKRCFFIIPEKGRHDYYDSCIDLEGEFINVFPGSDVCINPLAIIPEGKINEAMLEKDDLVTTSGLVSKKITTVITWIQLLLNGDTLTEKETAVLNRTLFNLYSNMGIVNEDPCSVYENGMNGKVKDMPILSDLYKGILRENGMDRVVSALEPFVNGDAKNFNGQSNIDLNNNYIVFNVDADRIGDRLLPAMLYLPFIISYDAVKNSPNTQDIIFLDEVWKMMISEQCAKQVHSMTKLIRGYRGGVVIATQEIGDMLRAKGDYGKTVIMNTSIKLLLQIAEKEIDQLEGVISLTPAEKEEVQKFHHQCYFIANGLKTTLNIRGSEYATNVITPDRETH